MQFMLCGSLFNIESLFQCFYNKNKDNDKLINNRFSLVIEKNISSYDFELQYDESRVSIIDEHLFYLNNPLSKNVLPHIFTKRIVKGLFLPDVIHKDICPFYRDLVISCFQERDIIKLHVKLNNVHILITTYPLWDNKKKIIGCTLIETPFSDIDNKKHMKSFDDSSIEILN